LSREEDELLMEDLKADEKEKAEHIMLVDLGRNDIGRVCQPGSVKVTELLEIEKYSQVMHLVSNVEGKLRDDKNPFDVLRATFPAGTVSGAPKVRAMEIIDELEPTRRGIYAGAVGYIGFDGNLDMCIAIRTILLKNETAYIQAGAGIVADSVPEREYHETLAKAKALFRAVEMGMDGDHHE
jgi:anthranilate synthase component 1